jgi:hypothetical protein
MPETNTRKIAAIPLSDSGDIDSLLARVAGKYLGAGYRVCGFIQSEEKPEPERDGNLYLNVIDGHNAIQISQELGRCASGCRADTMALANANALIEQALDNDVDLLVLNRFGRCESEGGGLRSVIEKACMKEIPVLIPVRPKYLDQWHAFAADLAHPIAEDYADICSWCDIVLGIKVP